jgi:hypothetical protein
MKLIHPPLYSWSNCLGVLIVGIVTVIVLFITPSFVHAQFNGRSPQGALSSQHTDLATDHQNLGLDHTQIHQKLETLLETMKTMTTTAPAPAPLCGAGTDGQRYVLSEDGQSACDKTTGYHWEQSPSTLTYNQENARAHCASLGGGYRLPGIKELATVIDYSVGDQAALLNAGPFSGLLFADYWTATPYAPIATASWAINFRNGDFGAAANWKSFPAWCVR